MENQHRKIKGYRELTEKEIHLMNQAKELAAAVGVLVEALEEHDSTDQRWVEAGKLSLQTGFMQLIRGVAKPTTF